MLDDDAESQMQCWVRLKSIDWCSARIFWKNAILEWNSMTSQWWAGYALVVDAPAYTMPSSLLPSMNRTCSVL